MFTSGVPSFKCDRLEFNYHFFYIGEDCATMGWNYIGTSCTQRTYTLQAFSPSEVMSNDLSAPRVSLSSTSGKFTFLTKSLGDTSLHFRVIATDAVGMTCASESQWQFYNFAMVLENGMCLTYHLEWEA